MTMTPNIMKLDVEKIIPAEIYQRYKSVYGDKNLVTAAVLSVWADCMARGMLAVNDYARQTQLAIADQALSLEWVQYHLNGDDSKEVK